MYKYVHEKFYLEPNYTRIELYSNTIDITIQVVNIFNSRKSSVFFKILILLWFYIFIFNR